MRRCLIWFSKMCTLAHTHSYKETCALLFSTSQIVTSLLRVRKPRFGKINMLKVTWTHGDNYELKQFWILVLQFPDRIVFHLSDRSVLLALSLLKETPAPHPPAQSRIVWVGVKCSKTLGEYLKASLLDSISKQSWWQCMQFNLYSSTERWSRYSEELLIKVSINSCYLRKKIFSAVTCESLDTFRINILVKIVYLILEICHSCVSCSLAL